MGDLHALISDQVQMRFAAQTESYGSLAQLRGRGTTTSAGAAGGTTLIDVDGAALSGTANLLNGRYWVRCLSGANKGRWHRIVDDDGAGTLTLEGAGFPSQVALAVEYEIWLMPEAEVSVATVGGTLSTTQWNDDDNDEDDSFWVGYWAVPLSGNNRGEIRQVSAFDKAGGASDGLFTVSSAFTNAFVGGDVIAMLKFAEVANFASGTAENYLRKIANRVNFARGDGMVGARGGALSFETDVLASGTLSADTVQSGLSVLAPLFQAAHMVEVRGTTTKIDDAGAAGTTTSLIIDTGTHENFEIGQMIVHAGDATFITAKTDGGAGADTLTVSPPLPTIPLDNNVIYGTTMYRRTVDGDVRGCNIEFEQDGIRHKFFGCKGNVEFVGGEKPMFKWSFTYDHYIRDLEALPATIGSSQYGTTALPVLGKDLVAYLDTTKADVGNVTATAGCAVTTRNVSGRYGINGVAGTQLTAQDAGITFDMLLEANDDLDQDDWWQARTSKAVRMIYGSHGNTFAVAAPACKLQADPAPKDIDGMVGVGCNWEAQDAGTAVDPTDGVVKVPDFAFHLS